MFKLIVHTQKDDYVYTRLISVVTMAHNQLCFSYLDAFSVVNTEIFDLNDSDYFKIEVLD